MAQQNLHHIFSAEIVFLTTNCPLASWLARNPLCIFIERGDRGNKEIYKTIERMGNDNY
jgi:hypothetical protein